MEFNFNFSLFFTALGLAFVIEASMWLISPKSVKEAFQFLLTQSDDVLRSFAATLLIIGLLVMFIATY